MLRKIYQKDVPLALCQQAPGLRGDFIMSRAIVIVLDSAGVGYLPDAGLFGDTGADTFGHIIEKRGLNSPNMDSLGLRDIDGTSFKKPHDNPIGCFGKAAEKTFAKDTTSGHWEIAGYIIDVPFKTYPNGFTSDIITEFERETGHDTLGNVVASGTEIIDRLGEEHMKTGKLIVYTSADSVFQVAAHEEVVPIDELYRCCEIARRILTGDRSVGRVIARPFKGKPGGFMRTNRRRDFALAPDGDTILDAIVRSGKDVAAVGKIEDIFCHRGVSKVEHTTDNSAGIDATISFIKSDVDGFIFTNLVDFDMQYGHRNDVEGYGRALEAFDERLPEIMTAMKPSDMLIITADHGCDPTFKGTDHTREYIPILVYGKNLKQGVNLGTRESFADIAATVYEYLDLGKWNAGASFLGEIVQD